MKKIILLLALSLGALTFAQRRVSKEAKDAKASVAALAVATTETPDLEWVEVGNVNEKQGMSMISTALNKSKKENKLMMIFFTSSVWCAPCKKIHKELLHSEEFKNLVRDEFVLIKSDFLSNTPAKASPMLRKLMKMFNDKKAVPCFTIIDNNGKTVSKIEDYNKPAVYIQKIKAVLTKHKAGKKELRN